MFSGVTGRRVELVSLLDDERSAAVSVALVAGSYFEVLGVGSELGRLLTPDDDRESNGQPSRCLSTISGNRVPGRRGVIGSRFASMANRSPSWVAAAGFEGTDVGVPTKDLRAGVDDAHLV